MIKELDQNEVATLRSYRDNFNRVTLELGEISILERDLKTRRLNVEKYLDDSRAGQQDFLKSLQEKYGQGQIDLDRGLFIEDTPAENKNVNPEIPNLEETKVEDEIAESEPELDNDTKKELG